MSVLLLHGFTGAAASWEGVCGHAVTLPGHEDVPVDLGAGFEGGIAFVRAAARALEPPVHVVGYSMGGRLALGAILGAPSEFASATLIGVNFGIDDTERSARRSWESSIARTLREDGLEAFLAMWAALPLWASQASLPDAVRSKQDTIRRRHDPRRLADAFEAFALSSMPDYRGCALEIPVTLLVGALDTKFLAIAEAVQGATVEVVAGVGHNVPLEAPAWLRTKVSTMRDASA